MLFRRKSSVKIHESCKTLRLGAFIEVMCHNNYDRLIIKGSPTPEQLEEAWEKIYTEYADLSGGDINYSAMLAVLKSYGEAYTRLIAATAAVRSLRVGYNETAEEVLMKLGYNCKFKQHEGDFEKYMNEVRSMEKQLKNVHLMFEKVKQDWENFMKQQKKKQLTEKDFLAYVAAVSKFIGYHISLNITVADFAAKSNLMNGNRQNR